MKDIVTNTGCNNPADKSSVICIICPRSCNITVDTSCLKEGRKPDTADVTGNGCKRGADYALEECINPVRTLTTTVRVANGRPCMVPVKSDRPVPKARLMEFMQEIGRVSANTQVKAPIQAGDIIIPDVLCTGVNMIATGNIPIA